MLYVCTYIAVERLDLWPNDPKGHSPGRSISYLCIYRIGGVFVTGLIYHTFLIQLSIDSSWY